jgi:hypothetical protein
MRVNESTAGERVQQSEPHLSMRCFAATQDAFPRCRSLWVRSKGFSPVLCAEAHTMTEVLPIGGRGSKGGEPSTAPAPRPWDTLHLFSVASVLLGSGMPSRFRTSATHSFWLSTVSILLAHSSAFFRSVPTSSWAASRKNG